MIIHRIFSWIIIPLITAIFLMPKGTLLHKRMGKVLIFLMVFSVGAALLNAIGIIVNNTHEGYIFPRVRVGILMALSIFSSIFMGLYFLRHFKEFKNKKLFLNTVTVLAFGTAIAGTLIILPIDSSVATRQYWLPRLIVMNMWIVTIPFIFFYKKKISYNLSVLTHKFYMINILVLTWYSFLSTTASLPFLNKTYSTFIFYNLPYFIAMMGVNVYFLFQLKKSYDSK